MRFTLFPLLSLVALLALAWPAGAAEDTAPAERPAVADFSLETLDGKRARLSDYKDKVVLVSFWATWCKPCKQELPFLDAFAAKYAEQGFAVLAINTDGPKTMAAVRRFVKRKKLEIPQLLDKDGSLLQALNPRGVMPFTLYLDREHRIAETADSFSAGDEVKIEAKIKALLAEGSAAAAPAPAAGSPAAEPAPK